MNHASTIMRCLTPIMLAGILAACESPNKVGTTANVDHQAHQRGAASSPGQMGMMDMKSMCAMHHSMIAKKTPEEREAMMNEHMKSMSPEMRRQHMAMMDEKCKSP